MNKTIIVVSIAYSINKSGRKSDSKRIEIFSKHFIIRNDNPDISVKIQDMKKQIEERKGIPIASTLYVINEAIIKELEMD